MNQVNGSAVYPAAGMLAMVLEACKQLANQSRHIAEYKNKDATFHRPLPIAPDPNGVEVQLFLRTEEDSLRKIMSLHTSNCTSITTVAGMRIAVVKSS